MNLEKTLKYLIYTGLTALLFTPLIYAKTLFFPYITGKAYFFRVIIEVILFLWLILTILNREYRPKKSWLLYTVGAFMISILVSDVFGSNWTASFWSNFERMEGYITLIHLFGLFLVAGTVVRNNKMWRNLFSVSIVVSLIVVSLAFKQMIQSDDVGIRLAASLGNAAYLAVYMLFHIFISLFYIVKINFKKYWWWIYLVAIILNTFILFKTATRGAMLGLVGGIILTVTLVLLSDPKNKKIRNTAVGLFASAIILVGGFLMFKDSSFIQNNISLSRIANISISEGTAQARILNWKIATKGVVERPLLGWGQSNYNLVFDKYYDPAMYGNENWFDRTHNIIFDWLVAGGILGLLFYLSIFLAVIYLVWWRSSELNNIDRSIITGLLAAYFFYNLFVFDNIVSYIMFFLILAFVHHQNDVEIKFLQKNVGTRVKGLLIIVFIILIPVTTFGVNYQSYQASFELVKSLRIIKVSKNSETGQISRSFYHKEGPSKNLELFKKAISRDTFGTSEIRTSLISTTQQLLSIKNDDILQIKKDFAQYSIEQMVQQIEKYPEDAKYPFFLGMFLTKIGEFDSAVLNLNKAIALSPKKQILRIVLANAYFAHGEIEKGLEVVKGAYELDTSKDVIWNEYAKIASRGDKDLFNKIIAEKAN